MSFFTTIAADAKEVEADVVAGAKVCLKYVDNVVVTDIIPELEAALSAAIGQFGQSVVAGLLASIQSTPTITAPLPAATQPNATPASQTSVTQASTASPTSSPAPYISPSNTMD